MNVLFYRLTARKPTTASAPGGYNEADYALMDARKRAQNERKFETWDELSDGGRRYSFEAAGRSGWRAREIHHKYPMDLGHQPVTGDEP